MWVLGLAMMEKDYLRTADYSPKLSEKNAKRQLTEDSKKYITAGEEVRKVKI